MPSPAFDELADALRTRIAVIADRELYQRAPDLHLEQLKTASDRIDCAIASLPRPLNGELAHYLQGCSFNKALSWLERNGMATTK